MANLVLGADLTGTAPCVALKDIVKNFPKKYPELAAKGLDSIHMSDGYSAATFFAAWTIIKYYKARRWKKSQE